MISRLTVASEQYRKAFDVCHAVFGAVGREFKQPEGVQAHLNKARELFSAGGDEAAATKEVEHARQWLSNIARKFLRGGVEFFDGRIRELQYMALDRDIVDAMWARLDDFQEALTIEQDQHFDQRLATYRELAKTVLGALAEQERRNDHRDQVAEEAASAKELERRAAKRQKEEAQNLLARQQREAAETAARDRRTAQFDELFGTAPTGAN